ncbi:MAG: T9SS type A sorting domain-containing protein [Bacteroidota bacterium]
MMKIFLLLTGLLLLPILLTAQQVTTLNLNSNVDDALIFDASGQLYGSRYLGSAVYLFSSADWSSVAHAAGFNTPNGLAFNEEGVLFVADNVGNRIYRTVPGEQPQVFVNGFFNPSGLIFEQDSDTLIATSFQGDRLVKIAPDGGQVEFSSGGLLNGPVGLCFDEAGRLYTGNYNDRRIIRFDEQGNQELVVQAPGGGPLGFITCAKGHIYGTLLGQHKIYRTDLEGNGTVILGAGPGTIDGDASTARFNGPNGITASPSQDTLYISEFNTQALRMVTNLDALTSTTGPEGIKKLDFGFYPNPATDWLQIQLTLRKAEQIRLQVLNGSGQQVLVALDQSFVAGQHQIPLDIQALPRGSYQLMMSTLSGWALTKAFVKN